MSAPATAVRRLAAALTLLLAAGILSAVPSPARAVGTADVHSAVTAKVAAAPGCRVLRTRLDRARADVRRVQQRLRAARAAGDRARAARLATRLAKATQRRQRAQRAWEPRCDRTAPDTRITSGPRSGAVVQARDVYLRVGSPAGDVERYECSTDNGPWWRCTSQHSRNAIVTGLSYGRHVLRIRAIDRAGNVDRTPVRRTFATHHYSLLSAGGDRTCGLRPTGVISCWGRPFPGGATPPAGRYRFVDVGPGDHACAIRRGDDAVVCWGADGAGQASPPPGTAVHGRFPEVYVGRDHTCTPTVCWGDDTTGELDVPAGVRVEGAGNDFTCGTLDNDVRCWGDPSDGRTSPPDSAAREVVVGEDRACSVPFYTDPVCWGTPFVQPEPGPVDYPSQVFSVTVGGDHACRENYVTCWGSNAFGQLDFPVAPARLNRYLRFPYRALTAGRHHTCADRFDGVAVCWGDNRAGQATPVPA